MKIIMIRHGKVDMAWEKFYDSRGWEIANNAYTTSDIKEITENLDPTGYRIYISTLPRTRATALGLFGDKEFIETPLLTEVPNRPFMNSKIKFPKWLWVSLGRVQWFLNFSHQWETRRDTKGRAEELVEMLIKNNRDCILVTHEFYLYTLKKTLSKHGFKTTREYSGRIKNLEKITATN